MKNILLLQTGGTIAMQLGKGDTDLEPERWARLLHKEMPELSKIARLKTEKVFFEDSSDVNRTHWKMLARTIGKRYPDFDGFVILHGTDTMAYTASALSFALREIEKPVIFTGSQVPMSTIRSDARRNLVNAVELATCPIPEVAVCFNDRLYRGNRSTKMSIGDFDAFASPNFPPLADVGIHINIGRQIREPGKGLVCSPEFDDDVYIIKLYPNLKPEFLNGLDLKKIRAIILEAFGSGNIPVKGAFGLLPFLKKCTDNECHIIITSQAPYDSVDLEQYAGGRALKKMGALSAGDMTLEATVTKTMHLLGLKLAPDDFITQFRTNLAGERS